MNLINLNFKGEFSEMSKFNRNNDTTKGNYNKADKKPFKKEKAKFVKIKVNIADSDFYARSIDSLYNLLDSIPFNKVAIPVHMSKSELFGNDQLKGTSVFGSIEKFNNDNTFTVSVQDSFAEKFTNEHVMSIRCKKDYETNEIVFISSFCLVKGKSVQENYNDVEQAMLEAAGEEVETEESNEE